MNVICLEDRAFDALVLEIIKKVAEQLPQKDEAWISAQEAMMLLRIRSKTTLQKLKDQGKIKFSRVSNKLIMYDKKSIENFLRQNSEDTF